MTGQRSDGSELFDEAAVRHVEPLLRRIALQAMRNEVVARDLVQETYLAAWQYRSTYDGRSDLRNWMAGILRRKIADHYRRTRREILTAWPPEPRHPSALADDQVDGREKRRMVERHLVELPERERAAVLLCDIEHRDRARAARALGVTRGHLRVLLHRGRLRLRHGLCDDGVFGA